MKKINFLIFIPFLLLCFCRSEPDLCGSPIDISVIFSVVDEDGNDLFFGETAVYCPDSVKFGYSEDDVSRNFYRTFTGYNNTFSGISGLAPVPNESPIILYVEFVPGEIDVLKIMCRIDKGKYECFPRFDFDFFFNDVLICTNCSSYETYELIKK
jgi:hypothetical protein